MIARSDLVIIVVSASLLATGVVRWQMNLSSPAPARVAGTVPGPGTGTDPLSAAPVASGNASSARIDNPAQFTAAPDVIGRAADAGLSAGFASASGSSSSIASTAAASSGPETSGETRSGAVTGTAAETTAGATEQSENSLTASRSVSGNDASSEPLYGVYIVKSGDYLGRIAQTYGTTVATLQRINGIEGSLIEVDQRILYPLPAN